MSKAEKFIKGCTRNCSNELCAVEDRYGKKVISYHEWLTPDQALRAVEIAREEIRAEIEKRYRENKADGYSDVCEELWDILSFIDSMQEEPVRESINFEQELYKAFGQVKDFTLGMRIAKRFYDMGKNSQEPVSEELKEEIIRYVGYPQDVDEDISTTMIRKAARHFANWQKDVFIKKACAWLENNLQGIVGGSIYIEDFRKYMEE